MLTLRPDGWFEASKTGPEVIRLPSKRHHQLDSGTPLAPVWHYTAGIGGPDYGLALARRIVEPPRDLDGDGELDERQASWNILVDRRGRLIQSIPVTRGAWHCKGKGTIAGRILSVNESTTGIELENAGRLKRIRATGGEERFYCWPYFVTGTKTPDPRLRVDPEHAVATKDGFFHAFTLEQEETSWLMLRLLADRFGWAREVCSYGHVTFVGPDVKEDPGPLWLGEILPRILERTFAPAVV